MDAATPRSFDRRHEADTSNFTPNILLRGFGRAWVRLMVFCSCTQRRAFHAGVKAATNLTRAARGAPEQMPLPSSQKVVQLL